MLPLHKVRAAFFTGGNIPVEEAWRLGAVEKVVPREKLVEEVRAFAARKLDPSLPAMKAHGVPWLMRHLRGEISLEEAAEGGKADTWRYAKRQETWFRHQLKEFRWLAPASATLALLENATASRRG